MTEVILKFERENQDGIVAVGSYLLDSAKRFGIAFEADCVQEEGIHYCSTVIASGSDKLSPLTVVETEHFAANGRRTPLILIPLDLRLCRLLQILVDYQCLRYGHVRFSSRSESCR